MVDKLLTSPPETLLQGHLIELLQSLVTHLTTISFQFLENVVSPLSRSVAALMSKDNDVRNVFSAISSTELVQLWWRWSF